MQVIINSSVVADGVVDLQVDCYKNGVLLCTMTNEQYRKSLILCTYGNHKVRQNKFGVCWCVRCGYLFRNLEYTPLLESDKLIIK